MMFTVVAFLFGVLIGPAMIPQIKENAGSPPGVLISKPLISEPVVKWTEPDTLVYRDYTGSYWRVGPALRDVRLFMREHDLRGPMFIQFAKSPASTPASSIQARIGLILDSPGDYQPEPPFRTEHRARQRVASVVITGRPINRRRDYPTIFRSVRRHDLTPLGPVMEIYSPADSNASSRDLKVEIQVDLRPDKDNESNSAPLPPSRLKKKIIPPANRKPETGVKVARSDGVAEPTLQHPAALHSPQTEPHEGRSIPSGRSDGHTAGEVSDPGVTALAPATDLAGEPRSEEGADREHQPPSTPTSAQSSGDDADVAKAAASHDEGSIEALLAAGRFDRIAEVILPDDPPLPPEHQVWIGQVTFRIRAVAKGLQRQYPGQSSVIENLSDAIAARYRYISQRFKEKPLAQTVVRVESGRAKGLTRRKRTILHDLDLLMGRLGLHAVTPQQAETELKAILEAMRRLTPAIFTTDHGKNADPNRP